MKDNRIAVAIPCYNEAKFIGGLVHDVKEYTDIVVVVDDGSTDGTVEQAHKAGARPTRHEVNKGAGAATRTAFNYARRNIIPRPQVLITMDGDLQHYAVDIPAIAQPILDGEADIVIGSRFISGSWTNIKAYRKFGIDVITWLINVGNEQKITDSQSCFRAYSSRAFHELQIGEDGFAFSVEILLQARQQHMVIKEVPIRCLYHSEGSTISPIRHGLSVAWYIIKKRWITQRDSTQGLCDNEKCKGEVCQKRF